MYEDTIKGYCKEIVCGQFAPKRQGIGLAMQHNQYYTMVLLLEDAMGYHVELEEPLSYDYANEQKMDIFRDVNNDGIQEICYLLPPADDAGNHTLKDYLRVWYQWQENADCKGGGCVSFFRLVPEISFGFPDAPACAVPVQALSRLVLFQLGVVQGFSVLSLCLTSFF